MNIDPLEVQRQVSLAFVLEPLAEKEGCTTRYKDQNSELSLARLQAAGVSVGPYFYELATRVKKESGQPKVFYDLFQPALASSALNATSKKHINYGLLELLFPFVIARLTIDGDGLAVCNRFSEVLKNSSSDDVDYIDQARSLAWSTSRKDYKRNYPKKIGGANLLEYYQRNVTESRKINYGTSARWYEELVRGMPILREMYRRAADVLPKSRDDLLFLTEIYNFGYQNFLVTALLPITRRLFSTY